MGCKLQTWPSSHLFQAVLQPSSTAPTLSSSYVRYPGGTCSVGHVRSASIAFLEGKCPAQEGRAEGLPSGKHVTHALLLEGLRWFPRTPGLSESCLSGREPALVLLLPLFLFLIISLKQLLKIPAHGQETEPSWEATCLYQASQALLCSGSAETALCLDDGWVTWKCTGTHVLIL